MCTVPACTSRSKLQQPSDPIYLKTHLQKQQNLALFNPKIWGTLFFRQTHMAVAQTCSNIRQELTQHIAHLSCFEYFIINFSGPGVIWQHRSLQPCCSILEVIIYMSSYTCHHIHVIIYMSSILFPCSKPRLLPQTGRLRIIVDTESPVTHSANTTSAQGDWSTSSAAEPAAPGGEDPQQWIL